MDKHCNCLPRVMARLRATPPCLHFVCMFPCWSILSSIMSSIVANAPYYSVSASFFRSACTLCTPLSACIFSLLTIEQYPRTSPVLYLAFNFLVHNLQLTAKTNILYASNV